VTVPHSNRKALERVIRKLGRMATVERKLGEMEHRGIDDKARSYGAWLAYRYAMAELRKLL
jgi:hypothetical protein